MIRSGKIWNVLHSSYVCLILIISSLCRENNDVIDAENCHHKSSEREGSQEEEENPDTESNSMTTSRGSEIVK